MKKYSVIFMAMIFALAAGKIVAGAEEGSMGDETKDSAMEPMMGNQMNNSMMDNQKNDSMMEEKRDKAAKEADNASPITQIQQAVKAHIDEATKDTGTFNLEDESTQQVKALTFEKFHEGVTEKEGVFTTSADFHDTKADATVVVDFNAKEVDGSFKVTGVNFHQVPGGEKKESEPEMNPGN